MASSPDTLSDDDIISFSRRLDPGDSIIDKAIGLPGFLDSIDHPGTTWRLGKMQSEKIRRHVIDGYPVADVGGVCIATQVEGPSIGLKAVAKIKMQITPHEHDDSPSFKVSPEIDREIEVMEHLAELNCSCTPKLYDYMVTCQPEPAKVKKGYVMVIIMEKLPGRDLTNFDTFSLEERDRVRIAFAKSMIEFGSLGFSHYDPARRNLIWDKENDKCYIIDLEDAVDWGRQCFCPAADFRLWQLASPEGRGVNGDNDPMVPPEFHYEYFYSEEEFLASVSAIHEKNKSR